MKRILGPAAAFALVVSCSAHPDLCPDGGAPLPDREIALDLDVERSVHEFEIDRDGTFVPRLGGNSRIRRDDRRRGQGATTRA